MCSSISETFLPYKLQNNWPELPCAGMLPSDCSRQHAFCLRKVCSGNLVLVREHEVSIAYVKLLAHPFMALPPALLPRSLLLVQEHASAIWYQRTSAVSLPAQAQRYSPVQYSQLATRDFLEICALLSLFACASPNHKAIKNSMRSRPRDIPHGTTCLSKHG